MTDAQDAVGKKTAKTATVASVVASAKQLSADDRVRLSERLLAELLTPDQRKRVLADRAAALAADDLKALFAAELAALPSGHRLDVAKSTLDALADQDRVAAAEHAIANLSGDQPMKLQDALVRSLAAAIDALHNADIPGGVDKIRDRCKTLSAADRGSLVEWLVATYPETSLRALSARMKRRRGSADEQLLAAEAEDVLRRYAGDVVLAD